MKPWPMASFIEIWAWALLTKCRGINTLRYPWRAPLGSCNHLHCLILREEESWPTRYSGRACCYHLPDHAFWTNLLIFIDVAIIVCNKVLWLGVLTCLIKHRKFIATVTQDRKHKIRSTTKLWYRRPAQGARRQDRLPTRRPSYRYFSVWMIDFLSAISNNIMSWQYELSIFGHFCTSPFKFVLIRMDREMQLSLSLVHSLYCDAEPSW